MKHMVFGVLSGGIVILFVVMLLTIQHKNVRKEELEQSLTEAMETTLQMVQADVVRDYTSEDMRTLLIRNLVPQMNSDSELTVRMLAADAEKGLLSVEVEEYFSYPGGKMGSIKCCRTILTDDDGDGEETEKGEKEVAMQTVIFYRSREEMEQGKSYYKKLEIQKGDYCTSPAEPVCDDLKKKFLEWRDSKDYLADFTQCVEENQTYYAVFE